MESPGEGGARVQRPLWASTATKNPTYPDTLYVDGLIGPDTVNTVPPGTLRAFLDHGRATLTIEKAVAEARHQLERLDSLGIGLGAITDKLLADGLKAFQDSFKSMMASISQKRERLLAGSETLSFRLGNHQGKVDAALTELREKRILGRIWEHDHTVWKPDPTEITNRVGWLHSADVMADQVERLEALAESVRADGYTDAVVLGMGGSSLAPEVFRKVFGVKDGYLDLDVLDSTDASAVLAEAGRLNLSKTLFIVSTKSGGTVETLSFFKFFYNRVAKQVGTKEAGDLFVAVTYPGTRLIEIARRYGFRETFLNDSNIGGRYSALSYFGLVPASLIGVDLKTLLDRALSAACNCEGCNCPKEGNNNGGRLGAALGELAKAGRDKVTLITSPAIASFGDWVEQLIAESTGKEGTGILPVVGEALGRPEVYGSDRFFVYLQLDGDETLEGKVKALENAGHPVAHLRLDDLLDLGGQFFLWEMATAVAGFRIGVNPFDQPNVDAAKVKAREMVAAYQRDGKLPELTPSLESDGIAVFGDVDAKTPSEALTSFLERGTPGAYISLQAYLQPTAATDAALRELRTRLRDRSRLATTTGYGPRFLHSTGQLHKGDAGKGLFVQITSDPSEDAAIPNAAGSEDSSISFGVLKMAQSLGDRQALLDAGRQVVRFHLGTDIVGGLEELSHAL